VACHNPSLGRWLETQLHHFGKYCTVVQVRENQLNTARIKCLPLTLGWSVSDGNRDNTACRVPTWHTNYQGLIEFLTGVEKKVTTGDGDIESLGGSQINSDDLHCSPILWGGVTPTGRDCERSEHSAGSACNSPRSRITSPPPTAGHPRLS